MVIMDEFEIQKCGVKFDPPSIVIAYNELKTQKHRRRTMPLRDFTKASKVPQACSDLLHNPRHEKYVRLIPKAQLERLITIIHDNLNGMSLTASLARNDAMDRIDPEEDLNRVDEETLQRKKSIMETTFERNQIKPNDPSFQYEVEQEFECEHPIESGWDSDNDSDPDF